ncbi:hypothetical protein LOTGIDRAFT_233347 [Lottia gigantea]|uniref:Uncharacterized protein n=1 Tax=Lottia gigantea TaxID=225164 RepID=V4A9L2_LOTGI|nr:hypothetical protein LOTGIDRAFT_233347 [Lottia gigantea]ESO91765.1 hypothetical protein LOTGIDRAFT_233347 [Lottia gigantea]
MHQVTVSVILMVLVSTVQSCRMQGQSCTPGASVNNIGSPGMGMPGMGMPGMGMPGMGMPGMGMPGMGMPGMGMPGMGMGTPGMTAQSSKCCTGYCDTMTYKCKGSMG